jgi:ABC-type branched-subunit amino acid transport system ATPase component
MTVVGGLGTVTGALAGPAYVIGVPLLFGDAPAARFATSGIGLLVLLLYFPSGFAGIAAAARTALVGRALRRHEPDAAEPAAAVAPASVVVPRAPADGGAPGYTGPPAARRATDDGPALRFDEVTVRFGGRVAADAVCLDLLPGEIHGLIGPNGAGKSTLLDAATGLVGVDDGRVLLDARDITGLTPHRRARAGLGRSFQDARLFGHLTVREAVQVGLEARHRTLLIPSVLALPTSWRHEGRSRRTADEILGLLGLAGYAGTPVSALSTGTRRIAEFALVLAARPHVLLLDEPTAGVAQRDAEAFGPLIRSVAAELGASVLVVEHDVPLLSGLCDRMTCLVAGRVLRTGTPQQVLSDPTVVAAYLGTDENAVARSGALASGAP